MCLSSFLKGFILNVGFDLVFDELDNNEMLYTAGYEHEALMTKTAKMF